MPLRNVATTFTIEQQRLEINNLAGDVNNIATGVTATTATALAAGATGADLTLSGTLTVNGTQTILNTATLEVEDKNIVIAKGSTTDAAASGGGITLKGADDKTISYNQTGDKWVSNKDFEASAFYGDGSNLTGISSPGGANALSFNDDVKLIVGSGNDLEIYHSGHENYIKDAGNAGSGAGTIIVDGSNGVKLRAEGSDILHADTNLKSYAHFYIFNSKNLVMQGAGSVLSTDGKVGIGLSNPNWPLTVQGSSGTTTIGCKNTGGNASVYIEASDGNAAKLILTEAGTGSYSLQVGNDNALMFFDDSTERLRIDSSGNATFTENINLAEGKKTIFGSDSGTGAYIKHQSGHLEIKNETGNLYWDNIGSVRLRTGASYTTALEIIGQNATFGGTVSDPKGDLRSVPANEPGNTNYTLAASDAGKYVDSQGSGTTITVPANTFSQGDVVTILRATSGDCIIAQGSGVTMYHSADGANTTTGNRTLAQRGMATMIFVNANYCYISGAGLS